MELKRKAKQNFIEQFDLSKKNVSMLCSFKVIFSNVQVYFSLGIASYN